jgi:hypothetical protein
VLQELGEARDTPNDIIFDDLWSAAFADQPLGRSVLGDEESIEAITVEDLHDWRRGQYRAGSLILVAAGKVDHDALVELAESALRRSPGGDRRAPSRRASPAATGSAAQGGPGASRARPGPRRPSSTRIISPRGSSPTSSAAACPRACSSRCARIAASPTPSIAASAPYRDAGLFYVYAATARRQSAAAAAADRGVLAAAPTLTQRELDRSAPRPRPGC